MCAAATAIGGMLFGYDTGVISGVLVVIGNDLNNRPLSDTDKELITTLCAAGAFIGAIIAGVTADKFGRKLATWFASVLFTIGAIIQATSYTIAQMSVGRILIGLGVGAASMIVPVSFPFPFVEVSGKPDSPYETVSSGSEISYYRYTHCLALPMSLLTAAALYRRD